MSLERTDVLQTNCYEVKTGLRHLLRNRSEAETTVSKWVKSQNFPKETLTRVTLALRGLHRSIQADRGAAAGACEATWRQLEALR